MNLKLDDIQQQLQDSLERLLARNYSFEARQKHVQEPHGHSRETWAQLAELGVLGAAIGENFGGFGGDAVDQMLVSSALGRVLALEPYHSTVVMGAAAVGLLGTPAQQDHWLGRIARGEARLGWAHQALPGSEAATATRATDGGWRLSGAKTLVVDAPNCAHFIASAEVQGEGAALFLVAADAGGVAPEPYRLVDGSLAADLHFEAAAAQRLDGVTGAAADAALRKVLHTGIAAACAEMVGLMEGASALAWDYIKTRQQFGKAIGSNQVLQHRSVEMLVGLEQSRSLATSLALSLAGRNDLVAGDAQYHAAKVLVGRNARAVAHDAIQMHGGMGMTEECAVGHYLRRLMVLDQLHGDTQDHLRALEQA